MKSVKYKVNLQIHQYEHELLSRSVTEVVEYVVLSALPVCACCRHPLFPLLALLFEKCEQSTMSAECITSASFDVDIENFVRCQEKEGKPFFSDDPELDNLVRLLQGAPAAFFLFFLTLNTDVRHLTCG